MHRIFYFSFCKSHSKITFVTAAAEVSAPTVVETPVSVEVEASPVEEVPVKVKPARGRAVKKCEYI